MSANRFELSNDFKSALRHFVDYYTNGTLAYVVGDEKCGRVGVECIP